jgi:hypothetical protein
LTRSWRMGDTTKRSISCRFTSVFASLLLKIEAALMRVYSAFGLVGQQHWMFSTLLLLCCSLVRVSTSIRCISLYRGQGKLYVDRLLPYPPRALTLPPPTSFLIFPSTHLVIVFKLILLVLTA